MSKDASAKGKSSRAKGARGERELVRWFRDELGIVGASRNLQQYAEAKLGDLIIGPFCIEAKNHKRLSVGAWWKQAAEQAKKAGAIPVLAYRVAGVKFGWRFVLPHTSAQGEWSFEYEYTMDVGPACFAMIVRESL